MNRIFKVIYSKTKHMYVVASELAKSHSKSKNEGAPSGKALAALVMAALASVSFMAAPIDVQAEDKTDTTGWRYIGVQHSTGDEDTTSAENYQKNNVDVNSQGALGEHAITIGVHTTAGDRTIVIGNRLASTSKDSVFIGSGYDANNVRLQAKGGNDVVVIGSTADATGTGSIALGYGATADPWKNVSDDNSANANKNGQSVALGYKAQAENNNIAIGANSVATAAASTLGVAKYRDTTDADYKATSYVSVGSSTVKRRITNVAAGSDANDAATVGQLEKVAAQKGSWQLTAGGTNKSTVDGDHNTVDFSAGSDGNLSVSKTADSNNVTIGLNKDLKGITSISNQTTSGTTTTGGKIELGTNGTTISGGDVSVNKNKITNLKNGEADTDAATVGQMNTAIGNAKTKYYSVKDGIQLGGFNTNADNTGADASNYAGLAAGYETGTTGIASTVAGSYSGVIGSGLQGAAAVSLGTVNVNYNTDTSKTFSGVANSIVGQANVTENSNASLIYGAGNSVTDSYRELDTDALSNIKTAVGKKDATALKDAVQSAVPKSGAQVMVMGGGNKITSAYMTQVIGVGNTITGKDATYAADTSTQYNYVDGANNTLKNGKGDYIIGANNSVTGDSITTNQSNIVVGDNHTLTNQKNNVVLGSADSQKELAASDAVVIGHNADVQKDGGVAIGSGSLASIDKEVAGYDPETGKASTTWKSTNAAVSVGKADGSVTRQITGVAAGTNDTDAVNVVQIKKLASMNASNIGANLKKADGTAAEAADITNNKKAWAAAIGTGTVTENDDGSKQLVTGGTVYNAIQSAKTKYYSVKEGPQIDGFSTNENNDGASAWAGLAAGYEIGTAGIGSTVVGSYSGVMNTGTASGVDLRGAASISLGTLNLNQNTSTDQKFSGVANSIIGQGNMTTNSNAAIILGAGNTITDSYKDVKIDTSTMKGSTPADLEKALQQAVPESGGQVMAIGGGNNISKAYKTQVVGLGNTVSGTELNYVEGFNNTVTGGTSNYIIGAKNTLSDGSKNIVFGDNHTLSNKSNNVVIGSADDENKVLNASDAVVIGHNADVQKDGGVAIGSESVASIDKEVAGYDPETGKASTTWKSTNAAVSVGKADGSITRQIMGVAAGTNDTDAVNVAQIKKLASINASNIGANLKKADGTAADATDITNNKKAWATAIGTGTVTKDDDGSKQLVTGGTVYKETHPTADGNYIKAVDSAATNLTTLDTHVKANADKLSDMDNSSVKYDTTTTDGKTTVDKTKITLAGNGGTTITNLKDGVNTSDAVTVGQMDTKIAGVTYEAGNGIEYITDTKTNKKTISAKAGQGITVDTNGINAKAGNGITVDDTGINVNTGKHLSVNANGQVDVGDNGKVAANDGNLVNGDTVYKALNGGLTKIVIGTPGEPGKDGAPGTIGLVGPAGKDGKNAEVDITIQQGSDDAQKGIKGANGVDGKDGITRIVYTDAAGDHQAATMEDGLKFAGDDGQTDADKVIAKKLNNTVDIIGGAKGTLTDGNIGVNNVDGKLTVQLAKELTGITSISGSTDDKGAKITLDTEDKNISVNGGSIKNVASNMKDGKLIDGSGNNAASISDVQTLVQQGVDNGYTNGDGITIQKDGTSGKNVISVNKGDGLKFDNGKLAVNTGDGLTVDEKTKALKIKASDSNLKVDSNGIGLSDVITIGTTKSVTIDGTKGEVSGLTNTTWDSNANYSSSTKAATESQVAQAMSDAVDQAGANDTHVAAGSYGVNDKNQVSMNLVDNNNKAKGTVTITDVAKASEMGDVSKLADGVKNADGSTTTVVDAINNVNTKIGDQKYSQSNTSGSNKYVKDGDSITSAIGKLDGAIQTVNDASSAANNIKGDSNIAVTDIKDNNGKVTGHQVSLKDDISLNSVTTKTATTDNLTVNKSATIGGVTIKDQTISGLKDTDVKEGSTNAVNGNTIWQELRPEDGSYIKKDSTTAQNLKSLDTQVKKTADLINSDGKTIKIGGSDAATKIDVSDKDGNGRTITGVVTDGSDNSSAANVGYVNEVNAASTQQIYRDMHSAYGHLNNNINKAAAGSNALAALHPLDYDPADKASYAVGYGHYRNANAAAVGAFYQPNANTMVSVGVSMGNGDPGVNAGVSFKVGKGSAYNGMSKVEMAETIQNQAQKIDNLEKENQEMKKQIQEILAKLGK